MLGRTIFDTDVLAEIGWMTVEYSYLEESLAKIISAFADPEAPRAGVSDAAKLGLGEKRRQLRKVVIARATEYRVSLSLSDLDSALGRIERAADRRDEIVHGYISYADDNQGLVCSDRVHKSTEPHPLTAEEVLSTHRDLSSANAAIWSVIVPTWNAIIAARVKHHESGTPDVR